MRGRVIVLVAAGVVSLLAGCEIRNRWLALPSVRLQRIDGDAYDQAVRWARSEMSTEAREGLIAANISTLFTAALRDPHVYSSYREELPRMVAQLRHTQLGRLQLAAFIMLNLERRDVPVADWWTTLEPVLAGLDNASFAQFLPELVENRRAMFWRLGLPESSAWVEAERSVGHPHGPLLQFLIERLRRVAAGDAFGANGAAERCDRLARRLLRQWTLERGSVGLRLLAADLLARTLESESTEAAASQPTVAGALAGDLRAWREAYRMRAAERLIPGPPLSLGYATTLAPETQRAALKAASFALWAATATSVMALCVLALLAVGARRALTLRWGARPVLAGVGIVLGICLAWVVWFAVEPDSAEHDLRRLVSDELGWPRGALVSIGSTAAVLLIAGAVLAVRGRGSTRWCGGAAAWSWLLLGLVCLAGLEWVKLGLVMCEEATYSTLRQGQYVAIAGPETDHLLAGLRAWQP